MGTGVGEAALAAEAVGAAEAATAGAGFLEGMAGVSAIEGAGVAGLGLGTGAGAAGLLGGAEALGGLAGLGEAGGLASLPASVTGVLPGTVSVMPEVGAEIAAAANVGAVPAASAPLGAGQIGSEQVLQAFQNAPTSAQMAAQFGPGTQMAAAPGVGADAVMGDVLRQGSQGIYDLGATDMSLGAAGEANAAAAAVPTPSQMAGTAFDPNNLATINQGAGDIAAKSSSPFNALRTLTQPVQNWWKEQNDLTKYGLGGLGAMQAAKYLNKPQGVAAPEKYSGPLSKFTYNPSTYNPYNYKPYAAGGPVEEMSRENAIGMNTGYPQADIQQGAYATPWQTPTSRNVVAGAGDANVDQMTGMERMARGGIVRFDGGGEASSGASAAADTGGIAALGPMMYSPGMPSSSLVDPAAAYAASQADIDMSRQNFQNFLARYQNLPVAETTSPGTQYHDLVYTPPGSYTATDTNPNTTYTHGSGYEGGYAAGGPIGLGSYSDGGRLLRGPGDGMSDNIPANISGKQPARLADGEFVVPADVVSGLGNGSTEAGAKQLYKMLDKVRSARTGTKKQGKQINPNKYTPA